MIFSLVGCVKDDLESAHLTFFSSGQFSQKDNPRDKEGQHVVQWQMTCLHGGDS